MDTDSYLQLIHKQLTESLSAEEQGLLSTYLKSDVKHQHWADEIRLSWQLGKNIDTIPEVNVEEELNRMHIRMDTIPMITETSERKSTAVPSIEPNSNVRSMIPRYLVIAASMLALIAVGVWLFDSSGIDGIDSMQTITALNGTKSVNLSDGSKVWLKEGSTIKYPKEDTREITLVGRAFFDVARDEMHPFTVSIEETLITVLGTSFAVNGAEDGRIELQVATGKVSMSNEYDEIILEKGNAATYNPATENITQVDFKDPLKAPWKSGRFTFKNTTLANILIELEEYYEVEIELSNEKLSSCKKTTSTPVKSINEVIQAISTQFQLSVRKITDTSFVLDGDQCQ